MYNRKNTQCHYCPYIHAMLHHWQNHSRRFQANSWNTYSLRKSSQTLFRNSYFISPEDSLNHFTNDANNHSAGVMAVSKAECDGQYLPVIEDKIEKAIKEKACADERIIQTARANPLDKFELGIRKIIESKSRRNECPKMTKSSRSTWTMMPFRKRCSRSWRKKFMREYWQRWKDESVISY